MGLVSFTWYDKSSVANLNSIFFMNPKPVGSDTSGPFLNFSKKNGLNACFSCGIGISLAS